MTTGGPPKLLEEACSKIAQRLAGDPAVVLPTRLAQQQPGGVSHSARQAYLQQLLERDPSIVLERHGKLLTDEELEAFEPLRADYEVSHYLSKLRPAKPGPATVKNRRYAKLQRLLREGAYFSDTAMRKRQPLLYHQYLGQHLAEAPPAAKTLSESILQQHDELQARERLQEAQARADAAAELEPETETSSDEEAEPAFPSKHGPAPLSSEQLRDSRSELLTVLQTLYLDGKDPEVDYQAVDADSSLDGDNAAEQEQDLEDQHFGYQFDD